MIKDTARRYSTLVAVYGAILGLVGLVACGKNDHKRVGIRTSAAQTAQDQQFFKNFDRSKKGFQSERVFLSQSEDQEKNFLRFVGEEAEVVYKHLAVKATNETLTSKGMVKVNRKKGVNIECLENLGSQVSGKVAAAVKEQPAYECRMKFNDVSSATLAKLANPVSDDSIGGLDQDLKGSMVTSIIDEAFPLSFQNTEDEKAYKKNEDRQFFTITLKSRDAWSLFSASKKVTSQQLKELPAAVFKDGRHLSCNAIYNIDDKNTKTEKTVKDVTCQLVVAFANGEAMVTQKKTEKKKTDEKDIDPNAPVLAPEAAPAPPDAPAQAPEAKDIPSGNQG